MRKAFGHPWVSCSLLAAAVGCSDRAPTFPAAGGGLAKVESAPRTVRPSIVRTVRERLLDVGAEVPEFSGFYVDDEGATVIKLVGPSVAAPGGTDRGLLEQRAAASLRTHLHLPSGSPVRYEAGTVRYAELYDLFHRVRDAVAHARRDIPFVLGIDMRSSSVRLEVASHELDAMRRLVASVDANHLVDFRSLAGQLVMPMDRAISSVSVDVSPLSSPAPCSNNLLCRFSVNPASGIEIGRSIFFDFQTLPYRCSVGFNAVLDAPVGILASVPAGQRYLITASHCTATYGFNSGDVVRQNQQTTVDTYATEVSDPSWPIGVFGRPQRYSDASLMQVGRVTTGAQWRFGRVYVTNSAGSTAILGETQLRSAFGGGGYAVGYWGAPVVKTGRTTGTSQGRFRDLCFDLYGVADSDPSRGVSTDLLCQNRIEIRNGGGDSGGTVWFPTEAGYGAPTAAGLIAACASVSPGVCDSTRVYISDIALVVQELQQFPNGTIRPLFVQPVQ